MELPRRPDEWNREVEFLASRLQHLGSSFESSFRQLASFRNVLEQINRGVGLEEIAEYLYEALRDVIPYDRLGLALIEDNGKRVRAHWARSESDTVHLRVGFSAPLTGSSLQEILTSGKPRIIDDLAAYLEAHPSSESTRLIVREGIRSSLTCPLLAESRPVGFLFFSSVHSGTYRDAHVEVFEQVAGTLSVTVEKALLYDRLTSLNRDLEEHVEALEKANELIEQIMLTDDLTGIANRRALHEALESSISFSRRHRQPLSVLMLDLDHFKRVNDEHGHEVGDAVLRDAAAVLRECCRTEDTVARYGGEEFVMLLPGTDVDGAAILAERVRAELAARTHLDGTLVVTGSVGVARLREGESADALLRRADQLLYEAKAAGRNRVIARAA